VNQAIINNLTVGSPNLGILDSSLTFTLAPLFKKLLTGADELKKTDNKSNPVKISLNSFT